jgi:hypothetical protein
MQLPRQSTAYDVNCPFRTPIAHFAVNANSQVTITVLMRRDSTNATAVLAINKGALAGITNDVTSTLSAAINTWQQQTLTFTPTEAGVVEVELRVSTTANAAEKVYIHDFGITQA